MQQQEKINVDARVDHLLNLAQSNDNIKKINDLLLNWESLLKKWSLCCSTEVLASAKKERTFYLFYQDGELQVLYQDANRNSIKRLVKDVVGFADILTNLQKRYDNRIEIDSKGKKPLYNSSNSPANNLEKDLLKFILNDTSTQADMITSFYNSIFAGKASNQIVNFNALDKIGKNNVLFTAIKNLAIDVVELLLKNSNIALDTADTNLIWIICETCQNFIFTKKTTLVKLLEKLHLRNINYNAAISVFANLAATPDLRESPRIRLAVANVMRISRSSVINYSSTAWVVTLGAELAEFFKTAGEELAEYKITRNDLLLEDEYYGGINQTYNMQHDTVNIEDMFLMKTLANLANFANQNTGQIEFHAINDIIKETNQRLVQLEITWKIYDLESIDNSEGFAYSILPILILIRRLQIHIALNSNSIALGIQLNKENLARLDSSPQTGNNAKSILIAIAQLQELVENIKTYINFIRRHDPENLYSINDLKESYNLHDIQKMGLQLQILRTETKINIFDAKIKKYKKNISPAKLQITKMRVDLLAQEIEENNKTAKRGKISPIGLKKFKHLLAEIEKNLKESAPSPAKPAPPKRSASFSFINLKEIFTGSGKKKYSPLDALVTPRSNKQNLTQSDATKKEAKSDLTQSDTPTKLSKHSLFAETFHISKMFAIPEKEVAKAQPTNTIAISGVTTFTPPKFTKHHSLVLTNFDRTALLNTSKNEIPMTTIATAVALSSSSTD
jgi:hypothetical protein